MGWWCRTSTRSGECAWPSPLARNMQQIQKGRWFAISKLWAHITTMAKSGAEIRFEARPMKAGHNWMVVVTFPDRPEMHVNDFPTEADARNWITNDSQEWLKKLGYGYE
jgi:hypothetical protein